MEIIEHLDKPKEPLFTTENLKLLAAIIGLVTGSITLIKLRYLE